MAMRSHNSETLYGLSLWPNSSLSLPSERIVSHGDLCQLIARALPPSFRSVSLNPAASAQRKLYLSEYWSLSTGLLSVSAVMASKKVCPLHLGLVST